MAGTRARVFLVAAAAILACVPPAVAQEPIALDRSWSRAEASGGADILNSGINVAPFGAGGSVVTYSVSRSPQSPDIRAAIKPPGASSFGTAEILDIDSFHPTLDGTQTGGALAAWYYQPTRDVLFAELRPGESEWEIPYSVDSTQADFSYNRPAVDVGESGHAIVAWIARTLSGTHQVMAATREPNAEFFDVPVEIGPPGPAQSVNVTDVQAGSDGTFAVAYVANGHTQIAVGSPDGDWSVGELGEPVPEHAWTAPKVGIDARGNVAAVWLEGAPTNDTGPVRLAFRPAGGDFGAPLETTLRATDFDPIELGVSALGEVVLIVEASRTTGGGGTQGLGIKALYGNTTRQEIGSPAELVDYNGDHPLLAMNARGDALIAWDQCCPLQLKVRRRLPFGSFGSAAEVQPPIEFEGVRGGIWTLDANVDEFSEGRLAWIDSDPDPAVEDEPSIAYVGEDLPILSSVLSPPSDPGTLPAVLPPTPPPSDPTPLTDPPTDPQPPQPPPPPPPPSIPTTPEHPSDRSAPGIIVRADAIRPAKGTVRLLVRCSEECRAELRLKLRGGLELGPVAVRLAEGAPGKVTLSPDRRAAAVERALRRRVPLRLRGSATDAAGNVTELEKTLKRR